MMIKKLLKIVLICGLINQFIIPVNAETINQNIENKNIILRSLDFKTVMMAFYQKEIKFVKIPELEQEHLQYVGVTDHENASNDEDKAVLIFNAALPYRNKNNQLRYLLTLTKFPLSGGSSPSLRIGKFQVNQTTIYIFKKNQDGQFQLLSESAEKLLNDDFMYLPYPSDKIIKNIKNVGSNIKGYVEEQEYSQNGYSSTKLIIMPFEDKPNIKSFEVAEIDSDNEVTGNDKIYNSHGEYYFLSTEHDGLYDIEIRYSGTKQIYIGDVAKIVPINETHVYHYNQAQQKYIRVK